MKRTAAVVAAAVILILTGCAGGAGADAAPKAEAIVKAFTDAGLPAEQPRDNTSKGWCEDDQYGCKQFYTTENVTVITAPSKDGIKRATSRSSAGGFYVSKDGRVMLSFLAQGTPDDQQAKYEKALETYLAK
ncbi:hypothetical protein [Leifsonia sp. 22587]|uniref:hypothetical protein n=1 Tax=Leifsonia sp. 22587 TaxID=3453946 RepID=UPI003F86DF02